MNKQHVMLSVLACSLCSFYSHGSAYQLREQSTSAAASANAGRGAQITDASLIYSNPAAITELNGRQLSVGLSQLSGSIDYRDATATSTAGAPVSGADHGKINIAEWIPHFFYSHQVNDRLHLGIGLFIPYGINSEYDDDFIGRNFAQQTEFTTYTLQPTVSYRLSETLSLGVGLNLNYAEGTLSKFKDHSGMCELEAYLNQAYGAPVYQQAYCNSLYKVSGDDYGLGYTLGLHWRPTANTNIGITYLGKVDYELEGDSTITNTPITGANIGDNPTLLNVGDYIPAIDMTTGLLAVDPLKTEASRLDLITPKSLTLSLDQKLSERWSIQASVVWTAWSAFEHIIIQSTEEDGEISRNTEQPHNLAVEGYIGYIPEYWNNTWAFAVGATYQLNQQWTLKTGVSLDQDPTTNQYRTARVPTDDRWYYALGANWKLAENWSLDLAYNYIDMDKATVKEYEYNGLDKRLYSRSGAFAQYNANYKLEAHLFSVQLNYQF